MRASRAAAATDFEGMDGRSDPLSSAVVGNGRDRSAKVKDRESARDRQTSHHAFSPPTDAPRPCGNRVLPLGRSPAWRQLVTDPHLCDEDPSAPPPGRRRREAPACSARGSLAHFEELSAPQTRTVSLRSAVSGPCPTGRAAGNQVCCLPDRWSDTGLAECASPGSSTCGGRLDRGAPRQAQCVSSRLPILPPIAWPVTADAVSRCPGDVRTLPASPLMSIWETRFQARKPARSLPRRRSGPSSSSHAAFCTVS